MGILEVPAKIFEPHGYEVAPGADMILMSQLHVDLQATELLANVWAVGTLDVPGKFRIGLASQEVVDFPDMDVQLLCALGKEVTGGADVPVRILL